MIETIAQDLKYAVRSLRRTPGFAVAAIVTLALGIGANSAIFTLLDAVMLKPLNVPAPQDLVALYEQPREGTPDATGGTRRHTRASYPGLAALMLKPLNVPPPQDLVALYEQPREGTPDATGGTGRYTRFSYPRFERLQAALGSRGSLAAVTGNNALRERY